VITFCRRFASSSITCHTSPASVPNSAAFFKMKSVSCSDVNVSFHDPVSDACDDDDDDDESSEERCACCASASDEIIPRMNITSSEEASRPRDKGVIKSRSSDFNVDVDTDDDEDDESAELDALVDSDEEKDKKEAEEEERKAKEKAMPAAAKMPGPFASMMPAAARLPGPLRAIAQPTIAMANYIAPTGLPPPSAAFKMVADVTPKPVKQAAAAANLLNPLNFGASKIPDNEDWDPKFDKFVDDGPRDAPPLSPRSQAAHDELLKGAVDGVGGGDGSAKV